MGDEEERSRRPQAIHKRQKRLLIAEVERRGRLVKQDERLGDAGDVHRPQAGPRDLDRLPLEKS